MITGFRLWPLFFFFFFQFKCPVFYFKLYKSSCCRPFTRIKRWHWTFLQSMNMLNLYISLISHQHYNACHSLWDCMYRWLSCQEETMVGITVREDGCQATVDWSVSKCKTTRYFWQDFGTISSHACRDSELDVFWNLDCAVQAVRSHVMFIFSLKFLDILVPINFSCLGECCHAVLLWNLYLTLHQHGGE